jgi:periplasmic divalent cation tolerance protein
MTVRLLYVTVGSADEAAEIGKALVDERLAACVNILSPMTSIYRWRGEIQVDSECAMIAKTRADMVEEVTARIRALHSYEVPCVVALPIEGGHQPFLGWIVEETSAPPTVA